MAKFTLHIGGFGCILHLIGTLGRWWKSFWVKEYASTISEDQTRKQLIDPQLEQADWYLRDHAVDQAKVD